MNPEKLAHIDIKGVVLIGLIVMMMMTLAVGYYRIQVDEYASYFSSSAQNIIRESVIQPTRGDIYDRSNALIVDNRSAFSLYVSPSVFKPDTVLQQRLAKIVEDSTLDFSRLYKRRYASSEHVLIKRHLEPAVVARLVENKLFLPGVQIKSDPKRHYAQDMKAAHVIGYVSEISDRDLKRFTSFEAGDLIGKNGLEYWYNKRLFGKKGLISYVYDALGNRVDSVGREFSFHEPESDGLDVYTTIDSRLQFVAESLMVNRVGSAVVLDVRTGGILAMASAPTYDPDIMTKTIPVSTWRELIDPKNNRPLLNRTVQGLYPPGSTYKMVAALTALHEKIVNPSWEVNCEGALQIGIRTIKCWNPKGHGDMNLRRAIRSSCNIYFYMLGLKIGLDKWESYSKTFQFGAPTGIDLPREGSGLVPNQEWYRRRYPGGHKPGHLAILAIGQGELLVTPIQMAQFMMIIANNGIYHQPHFVRGFSEKYAQRVLPKSYEIRTIDVEFEKRHWDLIKRGMRDAVNSKYGATAYLAKLPDIEVAGKTGTAQVPPRRPHSWFTGFAPYKNPEIAIVVLVENGGSGGAVATPLARSLFEQYFYGKVIKHVPKKYIDEEIEIDIPDLVIPKIEIKIDLERTD